MTVLDVSTERYDSFNSLKTYDKFGIDYIKVQFTNNNYRFCYFKGSAPARIYRTENLSEVKSLFPNAPNPNSSYVLFYFIYPTQFTYDSFQYYTSDSTGMTATGLYSSYYDNQPILLNGQYVASGWMSNSDFTFNHVYYEGIYANMPLISSIYDIIGTSYPIAYRLTNCSAPSAPIEAVVGSTVNVPLVFSPNYGVVNANNAYVTNNGVAIPSSYSNGVLTFTMPDPSQ